MERAVRHATVAVVAFASFALAGFAWWEARKQALNEEGLRFELRVQEIASALRNRILDYEQVLKGAVALFQASQKVERSEWATYVKTLDLRASYPGIRAIGYVLLDRGRAPVTYIEPSDQPNARGLGFDLYSDPVRRAAMDQARDTGEPALSAPVQLLRDRDEPQRPGAVMFLPVYRAGASPATVEHRRSAIVGYVYGSFRVRDLVERTIGDPTGIRLRLVDITNREAPSVLFEPDTASRAVPQLERAEPIVVRTRTWRLEASALPGSGIGSAADRARLVLAACLAIGALLTMLTWSLLGTAQHARDLARRMGITTEELQRFRAAADAHQDTMLMVDAEKLTIVYANDGACRNLGYRREELIGQPPDIVFADRDASRLAMEYRRLKDGSTPAIYQALQRRKDGSTVPVEISRELVQTESGPYILGVARDISSRLEAERALRESEQRLALALQSSGLALFDWDLSTNVVHLGAQWRAILGGEPVESDTSIEKLQALVHPDDLPGLREQLRLLLKGDISAYRIEHRVRHEGGEWIWLESVAQVSERDASGRAIRVTGTNGDITARKRLGDMKNAFVAAVSHELRTPLAGIVASLELIKEGSAGELPPDAKRFVDMAHANGERLNELINDVLDLERAESGRLRLELESIDVGALLNEAAALNVSYAEKYSAHLRVEAPAGLAAKADRKRLQQIVANFISNAAKFSPKDGEIHLAARRSPEGRVVLSVADQGP
ncbi:MAG TPA: CHASE domain-containing protein, partial [Burkholderiales bacterium]|nr:CHASE domain-containing protein [Burkholderiales bacterium]